MHHTRSRMTAVLAAILILLLPAACAGRPVEPLTVTLLKVGKADAIVLRTGAETMVIDTGEDDDGDELTAFLTDLGVDAVDVLIITHFDKDHVGGADTLADSLELRRVLLPAYESDSEEYLDFMAALDRRGVVPERLTKAAKLSFGQASVLVEPPEDYEYTGSGEADNDFSLVTTIVHGSNRLVFAGDMEKDRITSWLEGDSAQPCDFLKVPHHGVYNKGLKDLFAVLSPANAVICSSDKNPAEDRTLELLEACGAAVFQTKDGDVTAVSDGHSVEVTQAKS